MNCNRIVLYFQRVFFYSVRTTDAAEMRCLYTQCGSWMEWRPLMAGGGDHQQQKIVRWFEMELPLATSVPNTVPNTSFQKHVGAKQMTFFMCCNVCAIFHTQTAARNRLRVKNVGMRVMISSVGFVFWFVSYHNTWHGLYCEPVGSTGWSTSVTRSEWVGPACHHKVNATSGSYRVKGTKSILTFFTYQFIRAPIPNHNSLDVFSSFEGWCVFGTIHRSSNQCQMGFLATV